MAGQSEDVYCTLLMSDSYLPGALVLAHSLKDAGTKKKLACLVTLDTLSAETITELKDLYDFLIPVERIANPNPANLYGMQRPDLLFAFTKIALWRQMQFRKIVYVDADIVALRAPDELFDIQAPFAAAPDIGWPDAFNSGLMVITPDLGEYHALKNLASAGDSFDGADQGLLNQYYEHRPWERISFTYNCTPNAEYQWEPAYKYYKSRISMVHFIGTDKPWVRGRHIRGPGIYSDLLSRWWAVHDRHQKPVYTPSTDQRHTESGVLHTSGNSGDQTRSDQAWNPAPPPEAPPTSTEQPFTDPGERAENIDQGKEEPVPTQQQRRFSAPHIEWDATRSEPPRESKPEAANFPLQSYEFSESHQLFQAPPSYPEPPRNMWYEVPKAPPTPKLKPKAIFPWEQEVSAPRPTRIFAEDLPEPTTPTTPTLTLTPTRDENDSRSTTPTPQDLVQEDPLRPEPFAPTQNAWDNVEGIERYVRAVLGAQNKASKAAPLSPTSSAVAGKAVTQALQSILSPQADRPADKLRKESLILTDFPTAIERPSLPVTPAPIRRGNFWGEEEDRNIQDAEGVPDQFEWDPQRQVESLKRASLIGFEKLQLTDASQLANPERELPPHSIPTPPPPLATSAQADAGKTVVARLEEAAELDERSNNSNRAVAGNASPFNVVDFGKDAGVKGESASGDTSAGADPLALASELEVEVEPEPNGSGQQAPVDER